MSEPVAGGSRAGGGRAARVAVAVVTVLVAVAGAVALLYYFTSRDPAQVSSSQPRGPGQAFPDQGARHLRPGQRSPVRYDSRPPTSGPHVPVPVRADRQRLSDDQLLHALEQGNVVLLYGSPSPPPGLERLADDAAGPFDPALVRGGQAVILGRRPGVRGVVAVAWRHLERAPSADAPALRQFVDFWLGRGRGG